VIAPTATMHIHRLQRLGMVPLPMGGSHIDLAKPYFRHLSVNPSSQPRADLEQDMSICTLWRPGLMLAGTFLALVTATSMLVHGGPTWAAEPSPIETPVEEMPPQMARAYVIGLQEELQAHGYEPGPTDGILGSRTKRAIRQYQKDAGLLVNGVASKELLDHMKFVLPKVYAQKSAPAVVSRQLVIEVQTGLAKRGYYAGAIDGLIGPETRKAVRRFQADAKLPVTGSVDRRLAGELKSVDPNIRASDYVNSI